MNEMNISEVIYNGLSKYCNCSGTSPHRVTMSIKTFRKLQTECTRYELIMNNSDEGIKSKIYGVEIEFDENLDNLILIY